MKRLMLLFLAIAGLTANAQKVISSEKVTENSIHIIGDTFEGAIFSDEVHGVSPFMPTSSEVVLAESLLPKFLNGIKLINSYTDEHNTVIRKNLRNYYRQYFGYVDKNGDKIIYIHFLSKKSGAVRNDFNNNSQKASVPYWQKQEIIVNDGGTSYWQIKLNLKTESYFDYYINGEA